MRGKATRISVLLASSGATLALVQPPPARHAFVRPHLQPRWPLAVQGRSCVLSHERLQQRCSAPPSMAAEDASDDADAIGARLEEKGLSVRLGEARQNGQRVMGEFAIEAAS